MPTSRVRKRKQQSLHRRRRRRQQRELAARALASRLAALRRAREAYVECVRGLLDQVAGPADAQRVRASVAAALSAPGAPWLIEVHCTRPEDALAWYALGDAMSEPLQSLCHDLAEVCEEHGGETHA